MRSEKSGGRAQRVHGVDEVLQINCLARPTTNTKLINKTLCPHDKQIGRVQPTSLNVHLCFLHPTKTNGHAGIKVKLPRRIHRSPSRNQSSKPNKYSDAYAYMASIQRQGSQTSMFWHLVLFLVRTVTEHVPNYICKYCYVNL